MYVTDIVFWSYTAYIVLVTLFMLVFAETVRKRGG